ncbi:MAG TPA: response regulator [bacterium]
MTMTPVSVMLFEDDEGQATLTREALEQAGFLADVCSTGREGLKRMFEKTFQVFLIDIRLPDINGVEVLRRIKTIQPESVAIVVTGHGDETQAVEAMKLGADDYVVKSPYMGHLTALPVIIREGLDRRQLRHERQELETEVWEHARLLEERNAELRRANEELKRFTQLKSNLVTMVSHQLRDPLTTIKGFASILADKLAGPVTEDQGKYLRIIQANIDRLAGMINELLDMARMEIGPAQLRKSFVDLVPLTQAVVQTMRPLAEGRRIDVIVHLPHESPRVFADSERVGEILLNLVSNAIKYTPSPGRVTVTLEEREEEVQFTVSDTGVGIAEGDLPKLFEDLRKSRVEPAEAALQGLGVGLPMSRRLVELHGGRLWATSVKGEGSTFAFTLPKQDPDHVFRDHLQSGIERGRQTQGRVSLIAFSCAELGSPESPEEAGRIYDAVEQRLRLAVRRHGDVVLRWPGAALVGVLAQVGAEGAQRILERCAALLGETLVTSAGTRLDMRFDHACATYPEEGATDAELLVVLRRRLHRPDAQHASVMVIAAGERGTRVQEALGRSFTVIAASHGPDALEQLNRKAVDVILLDPEVPPTNGEALPDVLRNHPMSKHVPLMLLDEAFASWSPEDMAARVREALERQAGPSSETPPPDTGT